MKLLATLTLLLLFTASAIAGQPKNVIMVVGDGMGPEYTTAYRFFADDPLTPQVEQSIFDRLQVGSASTYPARESGYVTDSAAGATALASGIKSYNGAIGVDVNKRPVLTMMEWAKQKGMRTGLVVTSQIVHATPAAYVTHNESRKNYNQIADSFFDGRVNSHFVADLMLGGGTDYFVREDRNLANEFTQAGYLYIDDSARLGELKPGQSALGLFAPVGLPWALDRQGKLALVDMVKAAVTSLRNEQGYFLLIEGSQIDWAGHANDIASAMAEMQDLAEALVWLNNNMQSDTLLVVTADHSTGGMTIGADGEYRWSPEFLKNLRASPATLSKQLASGELSAAELSAALGFSLTSKEFSAIDKLKGAKSQDYFKAITRLLDKRTNTGWTTNGHTGIDVPVFAKGPGAARFTGHQDNTEIAKKLFKLLGKQ